MSKKDDQITALLEKMAIFDAEMDRVKREVKQVRAELAEVRDGFTELLPIKNIIADIHGGNDAS